jgi:Family of unknown function (DUF6353)
MNFGAIVARARKVTADNAPTILTSLGVTGLVTTAVLTGQASFKAAKVLERYDYEAGLAADSLPRLKQQVPLVWKYFVPAVGTGAFAVTCIIAANRIQTRRAAALASAYTLSQEFFKEYKGKVLEKLGDKEEQEITDAVAQDRANRAEFKSTEVVVINGQSLCFDTYTGRYFTSDMETIRAAVNDINFQINSSYFASLSDFYFMIGLDAVQESDDLGWNADKQLAVSYSTILGPGNQPSLAITFDVYPIRDYHRIH